MGQGKNCRISVCGYLSAAGFMCPSVASGTTGSLIEIGPGRSSSHIPAGVGGADYCRCAAGSLSSPVAQTHLAPGAARRLMGIPRFLLNHYFLSAEGALG